MKFAHTETGFALDPQTMQVDNKTPLETADQYFARYRIQQWQIDEGHVDVTASWKVEQVPDDTEHCATIDAQGKIVNPVAQVVVVTPAPVSDVTSDLQVIANALALAQKALSSS